LPNSQIEELELLQELGFKVNKNFVRCQNLNQVLEFLKKWEKRRNQEDYWLDGVVI